MTKFNDVSVKKIPCFPSDMKYSQVKKSLKVPKGQSEAVNRRTDNAMALRKRTNKNPQNITTEN